MTKREFSRQPEETIICKRNPIRLSSNFSAEILQARKKVESNIQIIEREKSPAKDIISSEVIL